MSAAGDVVYAKSFSQALKQSGSYFAPIAYATSATIAYQANINKYVLYMSGSATTVAFPTVLSITGCPLSLLQTNTVSGSATWINKGSTAVPAVRPIFNYEVSVSDLALSSTIQLGLENSTAASFADGSAIIKIVLNITFD